MSTVDLKRIVNGATPEERLFLEHYLAHLRRTNDAEYAGELSKRMKEMDEGQKTPWSDVKELLAVSVGKIGN